MSTTELIAEVTSLPVEQRALILDHLLRSLNPPDADIDRRWLEVAERRLRELRTGQVEAVASEGVFAKALERTR